MDVVASLEAPCPPSALFPWVDDLERYPEWLDIVPRAAHAEPHPEDIGPAWSVDLRGRLGPFARAKRLRMVRTVHEPDRHARFERMEHDGRQHGRQPPGRVHRAQPIRQTGGQWYTLEGCLESWKRIFDAQRRPRRERFP